MEIIMPEKLTFFNVQLVNVIPKGAKFIAMAGNRTRINCLEGNYAHHYTTIAQLYNPPHFFHYHPPKHQKLGLLLTLQSIRSTEAQNKFLPIDFK